MSRIGKSPITLPNNVKITQSEGIVKVEGPKGSLTSKLPDGIDMVVGDTQVLVQRKTENRQDRSYHGLARTLVNNMVTGVSEGFQKGLEISGVGYRAEVAGATLKMVLGYSSPVEYAIPQGVEVKVEKQVNLVVSGINKELVGRVASEIRSLRKPEPYKGKGIKYAGEQIRRKAGKSAGS